ncbi:hypothetical protein ACSX1C_00280 [Pseudomonas sp. MBLB4123]|uniref:hypothetical protein n=1 Tax=Pseudomonas sp. MBLB4123 TaxID=3451557 RepID=UPI003F750673
MTYYFWLHARLLPHTDLQDFLSYWQPLSQDVRTTHNGFQSILFSTTRHPGAFYEWSESVKWYSLGWMNEAMKPPGSLGYVHTLDSFNEFVATYGSSDQRL